MSVLDPAFSYTNSVESAKTNYLKEKWDKLYPGWNEKPKKVETPKLILPADKQ